MYPIIILSIAGILSMFVGAFKLKKVALPAVLLATLAGFVANLLPQNLQDAPVFSGMLKFDSFAVNFSAVLIGITLVILILSRRYYRQTTEHLGDIYALFLFSVVGAMIMVGSYNLVMFFVGLEILSIPLYILATSEKNNLLSNEAGLKYFLMGSFISVFLLLGMVLMYGITGSFDFGTISTYLSSSPEVPVLVKLGVMLIMIAFIFKISAAPFHFWAPDVYQGSPAVIMVFMATVAKTAAFGGFLRFLTQAIYPIEDIFTPLLAVLSALTMCVGNLMALHQTNLKRMLAFSSIANAGYVMLALVGLGANSTSTILYYMLVYSIANVITIAVYLTVKESMGSGSIDGLKGLYQTKPLLTFCLVLAMLSLAGIPPLAGFIGKYALFVDALRNGYAWLVILAALNSAVGIFYYFKVMRTAFVASEEGPITVPYVLGYSTVLVICTLVLLVLGIFPNLILNSL
ncbi:MAG TPA: NADH-quinone oxidoreductase subunit N [Haliscomenobacter sp.]|uniref:NADH-quinone oxidoreductase subunit N n=1 Tax=Haliscomenobacter sp. TaxID=2717303 RepID=UPI002BE80F31|nr:NADH-quinone oxidoreductase subunit N [Haliscomenobacter sp.]HOY16980.1 NADH-quinone oxidoreductase subunit N [Haliscomenobacter sp.]